MKYYKKLLSRLNIIFAVLFILNYFGYDGKSYLNTKPNVSLSNNRLHKLELIKSKELQDVKRLLIENKKCGYQENNLLSIEEFIRIKLGKEKLKS